VYKTQCWVQGSCLDSGRFKDGRALSIAFTVALLHAGDGGIQAIAAIVRDETTRWEEERALRRRLAELEARSQ
jgi:hypothetical protein